MEIIYQIKLRDWMTGKEETLIGEVKQSDIQHLLSKEKAKYEGKPRYEIFSSIKHY